MENLGPGLSCFTVKNSYTGSVLFTKSSICLADLRVHFYKAALYAIIAFYTVPNAVQRSNAASCTTLYRK